MFIRGKPAGRDLPTNTLGILEMATAYSSYSTLRFRYTPKTKKKRTMDLLAGRLQPGCAMRVHGFPNFHCSWVSKAKRTSRFFQASPRLLVFFTPVALKPMKHILIHYSLWFVVSFFT